MTELSPVDVELSGVTADQEPCAIAMIRATELFIVDGFLSVGESHDLIEAVDIYEHFSHRHRPTPLHPGTPSGVQPGRIPLAALEAGALHGQHALLVLS